MIGNAKRDQTRPLGRVLVVGASGFLGSALYTRLTAHGLDALVGTSRSGDGVPDGADAVALDITDEAAVQRTLDKIRPDTVFHVAGHVAGARDIDIILPSLQANLVGTVNVLVASARAGMPTVVLAASHEEPEPHEGDPVPRSPYAAAKFGASAYGRYLHRIHGLPVVNLRITMGYGPAQRDRRKLVPYVVDSLQRGDPPRLSSGARLVDWIFEDDIVDAFLAAATRPAAAGATVDVGSGELHSVRSVAEHLRDLIDPSLTLEFGALDDRPMERSKEADVETAERVLGWSAVHTLHEGLRRTVDGLREAHRTPADRTVEHGKKETS
jgi:UDP-glucose 4-epimerase